MSNLDYTDIEVLAFFIWQTQGCPSDRALEHWLEAEYLIRTRSFLEEKEPEANAKPAKD
jgi:hypothetical protein